MSVIDFWFKRVAGLVFSAIVLGGCFTSEDELIGYWAADRDLDGGQYAHWPVSPDGEEWERPTWEGEIKAQRRRYVADDENFPHQNLRIRSLYEGIYLAQTSNEDGSGYGLVWVYEEGAIISYHQADCSALTPEALDANGLVLDPEGFCTVDTLEQLEQVMRVYLETLGSDIRIDGIYRRID